jgi:ribosome maturation factor RimP
MGLMPIFYLWQGMRKAPEGIQSLVGRAVESLGYELVGVELFRKGHFGSVLRVYIDREGGINLDDCGAVSHQLSGVLDVEDPISEHYDLEVSSPGLDRPLFELAHFERFKGRKARLRLTPPLQGRRKLEGILAGTDGDAVLMEEGEILHRVPLGQIDAARLVPDF